MREDRYRAAEQRLWAEVGVTPTERFVPLRRIGTTLRVQETGAGPPVVFIHGASNSGTSWSGLVAQLPDFRCLLIDRPGCGLSEPHGRRFAAAADLTRFSEHLVSDVFDALELGRSSLVGTSYGGNVVLRASAAHGDRVDKLVCLGWPMGAPVGSTPLSMRVASIPYLGAALFRLPATRGMVRTILKQVGLRDAFTNGRISDAFVDAFKSLLNDTDTMTNELRQGPPLITPVRGLNDSVLIPDDVLASIDVPTCFLWGTNDPMGGESVARPFCANVPRSTLALIPGGHAIWVDDPVSVAASMRRFFTTAT
jgi:pimeloyl-ACP methyl ester carboxylesterase